MSATGKMKLLFPQMNTSLKIKVTAYV